MKTTPFTKIHHELSAKMMPFAGFEMPVSYTSISDEHLCVRNAVGIFDVSHMGEFIIRGDHALSLIQRISSNDASKLYPGKIQYSCLLNNEGGIVDDMLVYQLQEKSYMLVVNASNVAKDWNWISQNNTEKAEMVNISDRTALLAIQGPKAAEALQELTDIQLSEIKYYTFEKGVFGGIENVLISATGYTGAGGFEIYFDQKYGEKIWRKVMKAGQKVGMQAAGLGARDTLRLEKGYCLYGNDMDETTTPLEAGLGWITKFKKEFNAKSALQAQKEAGVSRKLVGFLIEGRGIARQGYEIVDDGGAIIGKVTSGTFSPSLKRGIAMGYVATEYAALDTTIFIKVRNKMVEARVIKLPFL